jgi:23S rRNA (adenine2503-C2)-methyltransferase
MKIINVPTGKIGILNGERGMPIEFLSLGDYGKEKNVKADFLGLRNEVESVPNESVIMPLEEKMVITISTQYGCSMGCKFCDVPSVGRGINATYYDLLNQIKQGLTLYPEITWTKRLNIHFARMGEPTFNGNVLDIAVCLKRHIYDFYQESSIHKGVIHPVVSTMMPKNNRHLSRFLDIWCNDIKNNHYNGNAGLQLSINSTDEAQRREMFSGNAMSLEDISHEFCYLPKPKGRKYALNFALADGYKIDANILKHYFNSDDFMVKITPIHATETATKNSIKTSDGYDHYYPYKKAEEELKQAGFDVLVFIPSKDEDEGMITCGNAVLSGHTPSNEIKQETT